MNFEKHILEIGFMVFTVIAFFILSKLRKKRFFILLTEYLFALLYLFSVVFFVFMLLLHKDYNLSIVEGCHYSPLASNHVMAPFTFMFLFIISAIALWLSGCKLPPLTHVLALCFVTIGCLFSLIFIYQISTYTFTTKVYFTNTALLFSILPVINILLTIRFWIKTIQNRKQIVIHTKNSNRVINILNSFLIKVYNNPFLLIPLTLPLFLVVSLILMLFGADWDSSAKAFTETACWKLSKMPHPDYLKEIPPESHYLCTVAVWGNPKIVKPIRYGIRHERLIIVNRQLLIANAFEELLQDIHPITHKYIRKIYDKYGFPLSKCINTPVRSNFTYLLMKPLEWVFLVTLYLVCLNPKQKINKQYTNENYTDNELFNKTN